MSSQYSNSDWSQYPYNTRILLFGRTIQPSCPSTDCALVENQYAYYVDPYSPSSFAGVSQNTTSVPDYWCHSGNLSYYTNILRNKTLTFTNLPFESVHEKPLTFYHTFANNDNLTTVCGPSILAYSKHPISDGPGSGHVQNQPNKHC